MRNATFDELELLDGRGYFSTLKVTTAIGFTYYESSNGVAIKVEPLIPGYVNDGLHNGIDLQFQTSNGSISANWGGFGITRGEQHFDYVFQDGKHYTCEHTNILFVIKEPDIINIFFS